MRISQKLPLSLALVTSVMAFAAGPAAAKPSEEPFAIIPGSFQMIPSIGAAPAPASFERATFELAEPTGLACGSATSHTSIHMQDAIGEDRNENNPKPFEAVDWRFESSTTKGGPWAPVPGGGGTITKEEFENSKMSVNSVQVQSDLPGLTPEVLYYFLFTATNGSKTISQEASCETVPSQPQPSLGSIWNVTASSALLGGSVNPRQLETHWRFEIAPPEAGHAPAENSPSWAPAPGGAGTISQAEAEATPLAGGPNPRVQVELTGLSSGTVYYVRLFAENEPAPGLHKHAVSGRFPIEPSSFETSGPPAVGTFAVHALRGEALRVLGVVQPNNSGPDEVQSVTIGGAPTGGTFTLAPNGQTVAGTSTGDLTAGSGVIHHVHVALSGPFIAGDPISGAGIPAATTITIVNEEPGGTNQGQQDKEIHLSQPATATATAVALTAGLRRIPFDATSSEVQSALWTVDRNEVVSGPPGGPYTVEFVSSKASSNQPPLSADASGLTPSGTVTVATVRDGFGYATHYHFEYVSQVQFEAPGGEGGFAKATSTPEVEGGGFVGADLPGLEPGVTYRYRVTATNTTPGNPVVHGAEQTLSVPVPPSSGSEGPCENERFRSGPSAKLPDCRAYEQVTPHDKGGAVDPFHYGVQLANSGALVGEDGNHVVYNSRFTHWGSGTAAGSSPYFFARTETGWLMTPGTAQPAAGIASYFPEIYSPDLTQFAFSASWVTAPNETGAHSPNVEFKAGVPGGPYATVASVPREEVEQSGAGGAEAGGWVAASADFSKLVLKVEDHTLLGPSTATKSGSDLYEYSEGQLRQLNVTGVAPGATIGACGASMAIGRSEGGGGTTSTRHSVSADGRRVFFRAVPGKVCSEPTHLYIRTAGAETIDIGAYAFLAANAAGTEALLENSAGELFLYDTEAASAKHLVSAEEQSAADQAVEIAAARYSFGVPGELRGFIRVANDRLIAGSVLFGTKADLVDQLYRYDSVEHLLQCISCASPFDPEPGNPSFPEPFPFNIQAENSQSNNGLPNQIRTSANGDYAFFNTINALVPQDVDGEIEPDGNLYGEFHSTVVSPSSDIYEWRRSGLNGCAHLQGCLSLISSGRGGKLVLLLGATRSGRDVFFSTASQLGPNDNDVALDIYDARIGGGEPPAPPRPVECEGDACSTPAPAPNDPTPSSSTFHGPGNLLSTTLPEVKPKPKPKAGKKCQAKAKKKCKAKHKKKTGKHAKKTSVKRKVK
jgi:hypothetical protein